MDLSNAKCCPVCGSTHDSYSGVAMHIVKMSDEAHDHINGMDEAYEHLAYCEILPACNHATDSPYYVEDAPVAE